MTEIIQKDLEKSIEEDNKISIAIMSSFAVLTIQYLILIYFNLIGTPTGSSIQLLSKAIVGLFYLIALPSVLRRNKIKFIGIYFITVMVFLFNYLLFKENIPYLNTIIIPLFLTCLPSFIYAYSINDWNVLKHIMEKVSLIVFIVGTVIGILVFTNNASIGSYSMSLSYYMLLPTIIYMDKFLDKVTLKSTIILLISMMIILALGSRGAVMCIGVFVILKIINMKKKLNYKIILLYILIIAILTTMLIFLEDILEFIYNFLLKLGIRSRSIQLFLRDELHLSGRENIYSNVLLQIKEYPLLGVGIAGDRYIIGGGYAHNIIIEVMANFGIIFGSFIVLFLMIISLKSALSRNKKIANFMSIWFGIGFIHLMVSGSYLIDFKFWIFLGLALNVFKKNNVVKNQ